MLGALALAGCGAAATPAAPVAPARPSRVASLDYCADQYLLALLPRERIAALSVDADKPFSYLRARAAALPRVRPRIEDVLARRPDLVVRSYGGGQGAGAQLATAGVAVLQLGYPGDLAGVRAELLRIAEALGERPRGERIAAAMDAHLAAARGRGAGRTLLYMTPGGVTAGPGTLVDEAIRAAGYRNFQTTPGWASLPLEQMARAQPDRIAAASFGAWDHAPDGWSAARHPVARAAMAQGRVIPLDGALTSCGAWFIADAVATMAEGAR